MRFKEGQKVFFNTSTDGVVDESGEGTVAIYREERKRHRWMLAGCSSYSFDDEGIIHFSTEGFSGQVWPVEEKDL